MSLDSFCCPARKGLLVVEATDLRCTPCGRKFPIVNAIPDFFVSEIIGNK
jgi:uncharacterized protein YbaR (Trm112 family)